MSERTEKERKRDGKGVPVAEKRGRKEEREKACEKDAKGWFRSTEEREREKENNAKDVSVG